MSAEPAVAEKRLAPWFPAAKFGMFIHWGSYAVMGHGEQPLFRELLIPSQYEKLADRFTAKRFDADDWAATALAAEMKYMVLTTKHHDGFCLFDTRTTDYNAVQRGPKRDLVAEYVEGCRRAGLRVGLYFSPPDWRQPAWFKGPDNAAAYAEFVDFTHAQVMELVSNYGTIDLLWFDTPRTISAELFRSVELVRRIREHQPGIVINNRLPQPEQGCDWGYDTPEQRIGSASDQPWESCITATRKFWGYHVCHRDPAQWHTDFELMDTFCRVVAWGGNLLLNVGPRADGTLPALYKRKTARLGEWIRRNREAVYGTRVAPFEFTYGGVTAKKDNRVFLFFLYWPGGSFSVPGFKQRLLGARFVDGGRAVAARQEPHRVVLSGMPKKAPDLCTVVELTFDAPPEAHEWAAKRLWQSDQRGLENWTRL